MHIGNEAGESHQIYLLASRQLQMGMIGKKRCLATVGIKRMCMKIGERTWIIRLGLC